MRAGRWWPGKDVQGGSLYFCFKFGANITLERLWNAASVRMIGLIQESNSGPNILKSDRSVGKLLSMHLSNLPAFCCPGHISFKTCHTILQLSQIIGWHGTVFRWIHNVLKIRELECTSVSSRVHLQLAEFRRLHTSIVFFCNYIISVFCNYSSSVLFI